MTSFITINASAYKAFSIVAARIEARNFDDQMTLASAGILPGDYRPFAVAYVSETSGTVNPKTGVRENVVKPYMGQRGLTFTKDSTEDSRVKYIVDTLTGAAQARAAARSLSAVSDLDKALKAFGKLSAADKKAFMAKAK
jgi:hypothetical protein